MGQAGKPVVQDGVPRQRAVPRKGHRTREVLAAAHAATEVMAAAFPNADWLQQVQDGIEVFLMRCLEQFASSATPVNHGPIQQASDYRHFARTAEEIKEDIAAEEGAVSRAPRQVPRYRDDPNEIAIPEAELQDPTAVVRPAPAAERPKPGGGWAV